MKNRILAIFTLVFLLLAIAGCSREAGVKKIHEGNLGTYEEMTDGTWRYDGRSYAFRLELRGRLSNAACDSVYVYLSNRLDITFEQAWKASGLSSNLNDYFPPEQAVLVELRTI